MALIKRYFPNVDTTYVYESVSYWDKQLKQPRSRRKLIGKVDKLTGDIIPTEGRGRKSRGKPEASGKPAPPSDSIQIPSSDADSEQSIPSSASASAYEELQVLYREVQRQCVEKDAEIAKLNATITKLTGDIQTLVLQLDQAVKPFRRLKV